MSDAVPRGRLNAAKSWLITAFAAPSALAVLAKIDDRLDFLPLLERIITGFDQISYYIWSLLGDIINIDLTKHHGVLSFYLICILMIVRFSIVKRIFQPRILAYKIAETVSMPLIFVALTSVSRWAPADYLRMTLLFVCLFGYAISTEERDRVGRGEIIIVIFTVAVFVIMFYIFGSNRIEMAIPSVVGVVSMYTIRYIGTGNLFFSRVLIFCLGVFIINFTAEVLTPLVDGYLMKIGV